MNAVEVLWLSGSRTTHRASGVAGIHYESRFVRSTFAAIAVALVLPTGLSGCAPPGMASAIMQETHPIVGGTSSGAPGPVLGQDLRVGLVCASSDKDAETIAAVYRQIMQEEGFPYEQVSPGQISSLTPQALRRHFVALILPEDTDRSLDAPFGRLVERYVTEAGGKAFIGYDAGIQDENGKPRPRWLFSTLTGVGNLYPQDATAEDGSPGNAPRYLGPWVIPAASPLRRYYDSGAMSGDTAKIWAFPAVLEYHWRLQDVQSQPLAYGKEGTVSTVSPDDAIVVAKSYPGGGTAVYVDGRPGALKAWGNNDFMMRGPLKYFLIDVARAPRLVASPGGKGGLVLNIHVCSGAYIKDLEQILKRGMLPKGLQFSFSVTAGPDCDNPEDGKGFDAANPSKGLPLLKKMAEYGSIGAHGGWIHNYWAYHFSDIPLHQKKQYIDMNFQVLSDGTGVPVTEYAAPGGLHTTDINDMLASHGVKGASIPTAFCAPPTHGWFNGELETRFWLFGYTGTQYGMALENMLASGCKVGDIEKDVRAIIDAAMNRREIRLFYTHPISIATHPAMWATIQDYILEKVGSGDLLVRTVKDFADFLDRHASVRFTVDAMVDGYRIRAESTHDMSEMTFALPLPYGMTVVDAQGFPVSVQDGWAYVTINQHLVRADFRVTIGK